MSVSQTPNLDQDMASSMTNLNSSSTQTTELLSDGQSSSLPQKDSKFRFSSCDLSPGLSSATVSPVLPSSPKIHPPKMSSSVTVSSTLPNKAEISKGISISQPKPVETVSHPSSGLLRTAEETAKFVTSIQQRRWLNPSLVEALSKQRAQASQSNARLTGFVSSEQLQEILQELSVDTVLETALRSPGQTSRPASQPKCAETLSPLSVWSPRSPPVPLVFRYPRISPYSMRKRRPPFHSPRRRLSPHCFYTGSDSACGKARDICKAKGQVRQSCELSTRPEGVIVDGQNSEDEEDEAEVHKVGTKCRRCVLRSHRCSVRACTNHAHTVSPDGKAGGGNDELLHKRHIRDSCGYWDSDSSSSTDYCYYHRPYCESCMQHGSLTTSDSSSDSDSEYEDYTGLYRPPHPVVFKEDLKPTFV